MLKCRKTQSAKGIFSLICEICGSKKSRIHKEYEASVYLQQIKIQNSFE